MHSYYVYILTSERNGTIYTGVTRNLIKRVYEHKTGLVEGFSKKYKTHRLVYYEQHDTPVAAITREKQLKKWERSWKLRIIEEQNPQWHDLYDGLIK